MIDLHVCVDINALRSDVTRICSVKFSHSNKRKFPLWTGYSFKTIVSSMAGVLAFLTNSSLIWMISNCKFKISKQNSKMEDRVMWFFPMQIELQLILPFPLFNSSRSLAKRWVRSIDRVKIPIFENTSMRSSSSALIFPYGKGTLSMDIVEN